MEEHIKPAGRPRDPKAKAAVLSATLDLMRQSDYESISIVAIAAQAGVAKQTIYNRWDTKADLVLDAIFEQADSLAAAIVDNENVSCHDQLLEFLVHVFEYITLNTRVFRSLIAAAQKDEAFGVEFRERFVKPREEMVIEVLERAQLRGELSASRNIAMLSDMVHGAFWYALLQGQALDVELAKSITKEIFWHD